MQRLTILVAALLLLIGSSAAAENITELKIEEVTTSVEAGSVLEFLFYAGNRVGPPCTAQIQYWVGTENVRINQGQDTVFLAEGETKGGTSSLLVPDQIMGIKGFFMQMQCNDATVLASRPIKASEPVPAMLEFAGLDVLENGGEQPVSFSYTIRSNVTDTLPIQVQESILRDGNIVWDSAQESFVTVSNTFVKKGPVLPPGNYTLAVEATGSKTARITREFVVGTGLNIPLLVSIPLLLLSFFGAALAIKYFGSTKKPKQQAAFPTAPPAGSPATIPVAQKPSRDLATAAKNYVCLIESESSNKLDWPSLNRLLDEAGFAEEEKRSGLEFADKVKVEQRVRSSVFIDRFDKANSETTVTIIVSNSTGKNWCDVTLIARIPEFLSENVSEVSADTKMQVIKHGSAAMFTIPKVPAMSSVSLVYSIAKWVSQEKANSIPLPAVINYETGQAMTVKLLKGSKPVEPSAQASLSQIARKKKSEKKGYKKKRAKKRKSAG